MYAGLAIYDAMQHVRPDVSTICFGMGMSAAAMIVCAGAPGKRFALPNAKLMIHQGSAGFRGAPSDITIAAREVEATTRQMAELIARHSGRPVERVLEDIDRDRFMTPAEAVEYGLVDDVLVPPRNRADYDRGVSLRGVHHLGFAVTDLDEAIATYDRLFGATLEHRDRVADQGVDAASVLVGSSRIELLAPTGDDTPVGRFLAKRGPGMHHVAYEVDDVSAELARLARERCAS